MHVERSKAVDTVLEKNGLAKATGYVIRISLTAALAGFIFGFDSSWG